MTIDEFKKEAKWTGQGPTGFDGRANYIGEDRSDTYPFFMLTRDDAFVQQANYRTIINLLSEEFGPEGEQEPEVWGVNSTNHWAFGYYDTIYIKEGAPDEVFQTAIDLICAISDYPILSEDELGQVEQEAFEEAWSSWIWFDLMRAILEEYERFLPEEEYAELDKELDTLTDEQEFALYAWLCEATGLREEFGANEIYVNYTELAKAFYPDLLKVITEDPQQIRMNL